MGGTSSAEGTTGRRDARLLLLLVALLVAARGAVVLDLGDVFFYGEELEKGALAKALVDGLAIDWHRLNYQYFEGGSMTIAHVTALVFLLVGESLLALKLVALVTNVLVLVAGWLLLRESFGRAAAVCFGWLFVLAPESIQETSLLAIGHHYENQLFVLLILLFLLRLVFAERPGARHHLVFGLCSGFGLYFSLGNALVLLLALLVALALRPRELASRRAAWAATGFLVGASPLLWMLSRVGLELFDVHGIHLARPGEAEPVGNFGDTLRSIYLGRDALDTAAMAAATLLPLLGLALCLGRRGTLAGGRAARTFAVLFVYEVVLLSAYAASPFTSGALSHSFFVGRLSPFWGLGLLLGAAAFGAAWEDRDRRLRVLAAAAVLVLTIAGARNLHDARAKARPGAHGSRWETLVRTKGYEYVGYFHHLEEHLEGTLDERVLPLFAYDEPDPSMLLASVAAVFLDRRELSLDALLYECRRLAPERWQLLVQGLGPSLRTRHRGKLVEAVRELRAAELDEPTRELLFFALGRSGYTRRRTTKNLDAELALVARPHPDACLQALYRGMGYRLYWQYRLDRPAAMLYVAGLPPHVGVPMGRGYREALEENSLP